MFLSFMQDLFGQSDNSRKLESANMKNVELNDKLVTMQQTIASLNQEIAVEKAEKERKILLVNNLLVKNNKLEVESSKKMKKMVHQGLVNMSRNIRKEKQYKILMNVLLGIIGFMVIGTILWFLMCSLYSTFASPTEEMKLLRRLKDFNMNSRQENVIDYYRKVKFNPKDQQFQCVMDPGSMSTFKDIDSCFRHCHGGGFCMTPSIERIVQ